MVCFGQLFSFDTIFEGVEQAMKMKWIWWLDWSINEGNNAKKYNTVQYNKIYHNDNDYYYSWAFTTLDRYVVSLDSYS